MSIPGFRIRFCRLFVPATLAAAMFAGSAADARAQDAPGAPALPGTWTLVSVEDVGPTGEAVRVPNPRGLLVLDGAGLVFEAVVRGDRTRPTEDTKALTEAQRVFAIYGGFWGRYKVDASGKTITSHAEGALSPNVMGKDVTRTFTLNGDRLTINSSGVEAHQRAATRWVWERVPPVENLSPSYRKVIGFWQHVVEKRVNLTLKTDVTTTSRAPSLIVYTPSGYVGVYFPPMWAAKPFAAADPTDQEAREVLRGFVGYFGALTVYPGQVFHHILGGVSPQGPTTLKRFFDLAPSGDEVNLRFPVTRNQQGEEMTTLVTMKRLSGERDMMAGATR
ncbi:MAG TPA: lipocalin-like domain-containing protein [Vicinamibacterales bacterium]|nr:lipocalin-like domain-containing protein [Vicinamibacterales bacterium]